MSQHGEPMSDRLVGKPRALTVPAASAMPVPAALHGASA